MNTIYSDTIITRHEMGRKIIAIHFPHDGFYKVGEYDVVSITPMPVAGQCGWVSWLEVAINPNSKNRPNRTILVNPIQLEGIEYEVTE